MFVPVSWLRDFAPLPTAVDEIVKACDNLGLVIEGVQAVDGELSGVVVGRVLSVAPVEGADKIRLAKVDIGDGKETEIICGAPNLAEGQLVPVATVGTKLPNGMEIGQRKMRGITSNGMICAADELGLAMRRAYGIMVLPSTVTVGKPFASEMGLTEDTILDIAIETNRPDANCMVGVARDLAAYFNVSFTIPEYAMAEADPESASMVSVKVESPELCPRFTARVLTNVTVGESEPQLQLRLTMAGMRPINNVVDASNYVMLELGQPSHPYDLDKLGGKGFVVRRAKVGETLTTLDDNERKFTSEDDCLICDANGVPIGIGGVMGGASSEIDAGSTNVVLEAAYFQPMAIAWTSRRYALRSEASARFERGTDPWGIERAVARFCSLLPGTTIAKGEVDVSSIKPEPTTVWLRTDRVNYLLGTKLDDETIRSLLEPIGYACEANETGLTKVTVPTFRPDSTREADIIEEVARHFGYENIAPKIPAITQVGKLTVFQQNRRRLREILCGLGLSEAATVPLLGPNDFEQTRIGGDPIAVTNPMTADESLLRTSLLPGLVKAVAYNVSRRNEKIRLFELGHVFSRPEPGDELAHEREHSAAVFAYPTDDAAVATRAVRSIAKAFGTQIDVVSKQDIPGLHPTRAAELYIGDTRIGVVGEIDPEVLRSYDIEQRVGYFELENELLLPNDVAHNIMVGVSRYPSSDIDLAFVVPDSVRASEVQATIREEAGSLLDDISLFDVYRGEGMAEGSRSLAFRLRFAAPDHTLTDEEVGTLRARCVSVVESKHGGSLR